MVSSLQEQFWGPTLHPASWFQCCRFSGFTKSFHLKFQIFRLIPRTRVQFQARPVAALLFTGDINQCQVFKGDGGRGSGWEQEVEPLSCKFLLANEERNVRHVLGQAC